MSKLVDFPCKLQDAAGFSPEIIDKTGLSFPASYNDYMSLVTLALAVKEDKNFPLCMLPFCHTVEAEALGGKINLGNGLIGDQDPKNMPIPRLKIYCRLRLWILVRGVLIRCSGPVLF